MGKTTLPGWMLLASFAVSAEPVTVAVLGASTAAGKNLPENGESASDSWVNRYAAYLAAQRPGSKVVNLAVSGYNTYHGLPTGSAVPAGRPAPDPAKNVTAAIATRPAAIIANYVGDGGFGNDEALANLSAIADAANQAGIPLWVATTQPGIAGQTDTVIAQKREQRDRVMARFGARALDFWAPLADSGGSGLAARHLIQLYDDNHPNAEGHRRLFEQVVAAGILEAPAAMQRKPAMGFVSSRARTASPSPSFRWRSGWFTLDGRIP